jgi:hypothetical protein
MADIWKICKVDYWLEDSGVYILGVPSCRIDKEVWRDSETTCIEWSHILSLNNRYDVGMHKREAW